MMRSFLAILVLSCCWEGLSAQITAATCRTGAGAATDPFARNATSCENILDTATCETVFTAGTAPARAANCEDADYFSLAIQCARTCSACCITPAVNCGNDPVSPIDCEANANKCRDPNWTSIMNQYCPATCATCLTGNCSDAITGCNTMISMCLNAGEFGDYVRANCRRTCRLCSTSSTATTTTTTTRAPIGGTCSDIATNCAANVGLCNNPTYLTLMTQKCARTCNRCSGGGVVTPSTCADTNANCRNWVANGFCTSTFYTPAQKRQYCGRSCNLC